MDYLLWEEARVLRENMAENKLHLWQLFQQIRHGGNPSHVASEIVARELLTPCELREWVIWLKSNRPEPIKGRFIDKVRKRGRY